MSKSPARSVTIKTYLLLALMVVFGPAGDVLLSKAMKNSGGLDAWTPASVGRFFFAAMTNGTVWLGITSLLLFLICYLLVLSWADYSYVSPASAAGYGVVVLFAHLLLREQIPLLRWVGVGVICLGVFLVGGTHIATEKNQ
jgi:uncharacterized membrane protein